MGNNNLTFLDALTVFSVLLQVAGAENDSKQASNDELLSELQKQDKEYLERILENQNLILEKLAKLAD